MNKFKKIMLGALSVLTLGLFVVTGTKANAEGLSYFYWKNSENSKLVGDDGTSEISITGNTSISGSIGSNRTLSITSSIIPNGETCADNDKFLKLNKTGIFTMTSNFYFNMNTFYDSTDAPTITIKRKVDNVDTTYKTFTSSKPGTKINYLLQYGNPFPAGTYTIEGTKAQLVTELYFPLAGDIYYVTYNTTYGSVASDYAEVWNSTTLPILEETGYTFGGWYYDSEFNSPATTGAIDTTKANNGNISLYAKWTQATICTISYELNGGTNTANAPTSANKDSEITLPTPTKAGYVFTGWNTASDSTLHTAGSSYTVTGDVTLVANWRASVYGNINTLLVSDLGIENDSSSNGIIDGTMFSTYNVSVKAESKNGYTQTYKLDQLVSVTVKDEKVVPSKMIGINVTSTYGATISVKTRTTSNGTARVMRVCDNAGNIVSTNSTSDDGNNYSITTFYVEKAGLYYLYSYSGNTFVSEITATENTNIRVMQQEAPSGSNTTYIRFIAIVKDVEDINASDFTFKVYCSNSTTTKSITRSVRTCKELQLASKTYSVALPYGVSAHTFDGTDELYAVYVIEMTDATYAGCTVKAGFTYGGTEYLTEGYTFAAA